LDRAFCAFNYRTHGLSENWRFSGSLNIHAQLITDHDGQHPQFKHTGRIKVSLFYREASLPIVKADNRVHVGPVGRIRLRPPDSFRFSHVGF
jgi:hypothetical protein